jgi:hypothetical protein
MKRFLSSWTALLLGAFAVGAVLLIGRPPEQGWQRSTSWTPLLEAGYDAQARRPVYPDTLAALDGRTLRLNGFMVAPESGKTQRFLLSAYPPSCPTCIPAGPESMVAVRTRRPVAYRNGSVSVQGTFQLARAGGASSTLYRMVDARVRGGGNVRRHP